MTHLKTIFLSAAALTLAAPAFAGQYGDKADKKMADKAHHETQMKTKTTSSTTVESRTEVMGATMTQSSVGEILQADGDPALRDDQEIIVDTTEMTEGEFRAEDDDRQVRDNAIVVPGSNGTITTVTCPPGTEAQTDMTCLITGDFEFED